MRQENLARKKESYRGGVGVATRTCGGSRPTRNMHTIWPWKRQPVGLRTSGAHAGATTGGRSSPSSRNLRATSAGFTGMGGVTAKAKGSKRLVSGSNLSIINRLFGLKLRRADISHARSLLQLASTGRIGVCPSKEEVLALLNRYF